LECLCHRLFCVVIASCFEKNKAELRVRVMMARGLFIFVAEWKSRITDAFSQVL
jgi:hypothetical protein